MSHHEFLGKSLATFQLGRRLTGTEDLNARGNQCIYNSRYQRGFRANEDHLNVLLYDEGRYRIEIFGIKVYTDRSINSGHAGIARGTINGICEWTLCRFPRHRVFTTTATK